MSNNLIPSIALLAVFPTLSAGAAEGPVAQVVLGIHGGTGMPKHDMTPILEKAIRADLQRALEVGLAQLRNPRGTSLDAVEAAIRFLEDSPLFNSGKGAVFTHEGRNELDASIMEGKTKRAGAVASVMIVKNPISAARAVMEKSKHVMLIGRGAEVFATKAGLEIVDPAYFWTETRWKEIQDEWKKEAQPAPQEKRGAGHIVVPARQWGTVGAVALDQAGNLAAGTSTGGMTNKQFGRVGDSPIIGAGTYADNEACAVSATGHGEYFIRYAVAHDIAALMKYKGLSVDVAAAEVVEHKLKAAGGEGGVIALDAKGNFAMPHNTESMYRGYVTRDGKTKVLLYAD
ncbi:MAG: isoaspartyl peptidase/L-asparaginase [Planctomycetia bacterium]|nr:isoaspartyl peptidase/L-asparaginase [Planctomycetia bacterium]